MCNNNHDADDVKIGNVGVVEYEWRKKQRNECDIYCRQSKRIVYRKNIRRKP